MNLDIQDLFKQISEKGISSALAILFCVFIYYEQDKLSEQQIEQGKDIVKIQADIEGLIVDIEEVKEGIEDGWDMYDDKITPQINTFSERVTILEEKIREIQRHNNYESHR